ncbi:MAG: ATP-binding protein [Candidatus Alcyoniella australis]|nr:ATP-binding protein [Candidatus Alcyoniella australis]
MGCPCGHLTDPVRTCLCTTRQIQRYRTRISGPLMDRIDIHIEVPALRYVELSGERRGEASSEVRARVNAARKVQAARFNGTNGVRCNAQMSPRMIENHCVLDERSKSLLANAFERLGMSARAHSRILKVGRTIADLDGSERIASHHLTEAIGYRSLDRPL